MICCSTHLCFHWWILVGALTGDRPRNLGVSRRCSNQLNYPARAWCSFLSALSSILEAKLLRWGHVHKPMRFTSLFLAQLLKFLLIASLQAKGKAFFVLVSSVFSSVCLYPEEKLKGLT